MTQNPYQAPSVDVAATRSRMDPSQFEDMLRENKKFNNWSLLAGAPGLILQALPSLEMKLLGTVLLFIGLAYYMKMKGRSPVWCLLGFLSILGFIFAAFLPKYCRNCSMQQSQKVCTNCGAPVGI